MRAVQSLIDSCPRLRGEITEGDRTPITDGFIYLYRRPESQRREDIAGRVAVQVKGKSHSSKKKFSAKSTSYPIESEVLRFFRDNGGGIYFCVLLNLGTGQQRTYARPLTPFRLNRMINGMRPGQRTLHVKLDHLSEDPERLERMVAFALEVSKQDVNQGFDRSLLEGDAEIEIMSPDGLDLSRPADLSLDTQDFAVIIRSRGLRIHADIDLSIIPSSYVEREASFTVSCGGVHYGDTVYVKMLDDSSGQIRLGENVRITIEDRGRRLSSELDLAAGGDLLEHIKAMRFFLALASRQELRIGSEILRPEKSTSASLDGLADSLKNFELSAQLFTLLEVDMRLIDPAVLTSSQLDTLGLVYRAVVLREELRSSSGGAGRFEVEVGANKIILLVVPGTSAGTWALFDPFDPKNRTKFRLFAVDESPDVKEITGTTYEAVNAPEMAHVLNLRLRHLVAAYADLTDNNTSRALANRKVLHLLSSVDLAGTWPQREALLKGAHALNSWLLAASVDDPVHQVNQWQISHRMGTLDEGQRAEIRTTRRAIVRSNAPNSGQLEVCCAILLGDPADVREALRQLPDDQAEELRTWPIWTISPVNDD